MIVHHSCRPWMPTPRSSSDHDGALGHAKTPAKVRLHDRASQPLSVDAGQAPSNHGKALSHDKPPNDYGIQDTPTGRPKVDLVSRMLDEDMASHACYHCRRA